MGNIKWTYDKLQEEANKYNTRGDFSHNLAYSSAYRMNLIDKLFENHINSGYSYNKWQQYTYVIYVYEFKDYNKAYVGLTNDIIRRDRDHFFNKNENLIKFCIDKKIPLPNYKILDENLISVDAQTREIYWLDFYKNDGWDMFNIAKAGSLGGGNIKWTLKKLKNEVVKYKTRGDFQIKNTPAYKSAYKRKLLDKLFKNHPNDGYNLNIKKNGYWTKNKLQEEVNKYINRTEFRKNNNGAYDAAIKKDILDELFKNHPNGGYSNKQVKSGYWTKEKLQEEANKYINRVDFRKNSNNAYLASLNKNILDELFINHIDCGYYGCRKPTGWINKDKKSDIK
ncbi:hypothetical protein M0Q97_00985 [Candidatus Dojkabacteria bacterium]|jgi:hypothetical protein|nr:hypothetical protein [Candidatus Dojkabacteria bacterium]